MLVFCRLACLFVLVWFGFCLFVFLLLFFVVVVVFLGGATEIAIRDDQEMSVCNSVVFCATETAIRDDLEVSVLISIVFCVTD